MPLAPWWMAGKPVIGVLHAPALPGAPSNSLTLSEIERWVLRDAAALSSGGIDAFILENFGDAPFFPDRVPSETVAFLTTLACAVRAKHTQPLGINVLRNDGESALAVAAASGAAFIRVNIYTGARVADQGILEGQAHRIQRLRRALACEAMVFADVAVKHSAALGDRALEDEVEDTVKRGCADAIIVSGTSTGKATEIEALRTAASAASPVLVFAGSGVGDESLEETLQVAGGLIVGTAFKEGSVVTNPVDGVRVGRFMERVWQLRERS